MVLCRVQCIEKLVLENVLITLLLHKLYGQMQLQVRCSYKYIQKLNVMVRIAVALHDYCLYMFFYKEYDIMMCVFDFIMYISESR